MLIVLPVAAQANVRADRLVAQAKEMDIASSPAWRALLHFNGDKSVITDRMFWLSENGRFDPGAEMEATIRGFFKPYSATQRIEREFKNGFKSFFLKQHPVCAYPARREFLEDKLGVEFPRMNCHDFERWRSRMIGDSISVIFASNTLNNPSSMFGHTFIRIDHEDNVLGSQTVNFAAISPEQDAGLAFAVQGFTGGYPGLWTFEPYFEKIKIYGVIDNRNLQEFRLGLTPDRVEFLKKHLWEIAYVYADYYFLNVNCSSAMIDLIRVAAPEVIQENYKFAVFPTDAMRAIYPLVESGNLRLSMQSRIVHRWRQLSDDEKAVVKNWSGADDLEKLPDNRSKARVVEILFDVNQYKLAHGKISEEAMREKSFELLHIRRQMRARDLFDDNAELEAAFYTHKVMSAWGGISADNFGGRAVAGFAPAYHKFMDDDFGMNKWSEIRAGVLELSFGTDGINLENFTAASLVSMNPVVAVFDGWSWEADARVWSFKNVKTWERDGYAFGVSGGFGKSYAFGNGNDLKYVFSTLDLNTKYQAVGAKIGLAQAFMPRAKNNVEIFANVATRRYGSVGVMDRFTWFLNRDQQIDARIDVGYYYQLDRFGTGVSAVFTQHF